jgi:hypothetical protein
MEVQARIPAALAALHNFIQQYDPGDIHIYDEDEDEDEDVLLDFRMGPRPEDKNKDKDVGELGTGRVTSGETARANKRRDEIAAAMWEQYRLISRVVQHSG